MENWNVYIKQEPYFERVEVYITRSDGNKICVLGPDMQTETSYLKGSDMGTVVPTMKMSGALFQGFVDAIAKLGIKPTQGHFNEGKLEAMGEHLKDMRALVFDKPEIINVENRG